jgi:hypothetical protein
MRNALHALSGECQKRSSVLKNSFALSSASEPGAENDVFVVFWPRFGPLLDRRPSRHRLFQQAVVFSEQQTNGGSSPGCRVEVFYEVRLYGVLGSSLPARKSCEKKTHTPSEFIGNSSACAFLGTRGRISSGLREGQIRVSGVTRFSGR